MPEDELDLKVTVSQHTQEEMSEGIMRVEISFRPLSIVKVLEDFLDDQETFKHDFLKPKTGSADD